MKESQEGPSPREAVSPMVLAYFLFIFVVVTFSLGYLFLPFWSILILSFLLAGIFRPVYNYICRFFSPSFSSLMTCGLIVILVFVPLIFFVVSLSKEALSLYQLSKNLNLELGDRLRELVQEGTVIGRLQEFLKGMGVNFEPQSMSNSISEFTKMIGLFLYNQASSWAANIMNFVVKFSIMILIIYFLLIDIDRLTDYVMRLSPMPDNEERQLINKFQEIAGAILIGNGICGFIQGVLGGIVFAFFGLGAPVLWGGIMMILAFLPIFGIGLVLIPAGLVLFIKGQAGAALFMIVFYVCLSFSVEYLLKPKLVGDQVKMHILLVFLSILGGLAVFGVLGIIYGPLIATAFLTMSEIYLQNYDVYVKNGFTSRRNPSKK